MATSDDEHPGAARTADITAFVDTAAPPPADLPTAHLIFGSDQFLPAEVVAERYHRGVAPLVIATGGVNRHSGVVEGRGLRERLIERGVPADVIRCEDASADTRENVELALPYLREALAGGLRITAVCKWYHRRAIHWLATLLPGIGAFHGVTWDPVHGGTAVTRDTWPDTPHGKRRVVREWEEVYRRLGDGSLSPVRRVGGAWHR